MHPPKTVLIVEPSSDEREVLRTALARRGLRIFEAEGADEGLQLARNEHPDVIVLDMDARAAEESRELPAAFDEAGGETSSVIVLGTVRASGRLPADQVIAKPYHFAPLVRKIEELAAKAA